MRTRQGQRTVKLIAAGSYLHDNAERLPITSSGPVVREFDEVLEYLRTNLVNQEAQRCIGMSETKAFRVLRRALIEDHMKPIVVAARVRLGNDGTKPYKLPRKNVPASLLIGAARGMAHAAEGQREVFVGAGLQPDFGDRLRDAAQAAESAWDRRTRARGNKSGSTVGIEDALRKAAGLIELLTVFVRQDTAGDAALFAEWSALALKQAPRRVREATANVQLAQPATATARLLGSGTAEPSTPTTSRRGLFGTVTRLLRLPAAS